MTESAPGGHSPKMGTIGRSSCACSCLSSSVIGLLLAAGCGEPSFPLEAQSDAVSAWLAVCASDSECGSDARCLGGVCTLACEAAELELCASMSVDAVCDTVLGACDVPCGVSLACHVLGAGYVCEEGRCRMRQGHL